MPEAKFLSERFTLLSVDHQPFANNYFSISLGFFLTCLIVLIFAFFA
jgi:hypothetical protein